MNEQELREAFRSEYQIDVWAEEPRIDSIQHSFCKGWQACVEFMKGEIDALKADAERYQWLRDKSFKGNGASSSPQVNMSDDRGVIYGLELDCTIDQARGKP